MRGIFLCLTISSVILASDQSWSAVKSEAGTSHEGFYLIDSDCKLLGVEIGISDKIVPRDGSKSTIKCVKNDDKFSCEFFEQGKSTSFNKDTFNIEISSPPFLFIRTKSGNVQYMIDKSTHSYSYSQTNYIPEKSLSLSKACVGRYATFDEVEKLKATESGK